MAKQQTDEDVLFNIALEGIDIPEPGEVQNELSKENLKKAKPGPGETGKNDPPKTDKPEKSEKPKEVDLIDVDQTKEDLEEINDDQKGIKGKTTEKVKLKTGKGSAPDDNDEDESPVFLHAAALQGNGVLPNFDLKTLKGLEPEEQLLKLNEHIQTQIDESIKEGVDEYKSTLGVPALKFLEALESGVPFDQLSENYSLEEQYGSITKKSLEENPELAEQVYSDYLLMKGIPENKVKKMVDASKEKETIMEDAVDGLGEIQESIQTQRTELRENARKNEQLQKENLEKTKEKISKTVKETKEIIPNIPLSEDEKKTLVKMLTVPSKFITKDGKKIPVSEVMEVRSKNPLAFELRLAYYVKNGFFDEKMKEGAMDIFTKKVETNATKKIIDRLNDTSKRNTKSQSEVDRERKGGKKEGEEEDFLYPNVMNFQ